MTQAKKRPYRLDSQVTEPLEPGSLVGSYFLGNAANGWQGCVVAEVANTVFLVELFSWLHGGSTEQRLVPLGDMLDWSFYDDAEWWRNSSEDVQIRWERQRKQSEETP